MNIDKLRKETSNNMNSYSYSGRGGRITPYEHDVFAPYERQYLDDIFREKKKEKKLPKAKEGRDYIKIFESKNKRGKEYLYLPLTWLGSKELASNLFAPKIKIAPEEVNYEPSAGYIAFDEESSTRAHWDVSIWSYPDLIGEDGEIFKDLKGNELRHEGKGPWLEATYLGEYYLFYFRDYDNLEDKYKKIAFALYQGSSKIKGTFLANGDYEEKAPYKDRIQSYWDENYEDYESQVKHIQEVAKEEYPKFNEYEGQKAEDAMEYHDSHKKEYTLIEKLVYNEETGRYDSIEDVDDDEFDEGLDRETLRYFVKNGEFTIPFGVIHMDFDCSELGLKTLKNGPTAVGGDFICYDNKLTSLKYAPKEVGGDFDCSSNNLTSLEGAPQEIGDSFFCSYTQITSLEGSPRTLDGCFYCDNNKLTTLKGAPERVGMDFSCNHNQLTTLEYAPEYVGGDFECMDNPLESDELSTEVRGREFLY